MVSGRRMTTDRFFGGVDNRLQNLRSMLTYVHSAEPDETGLWDWLKTNTAAESDSTIEKIVWRAIGRRSEYDRIHSDILCSV